MANSNFVVYKSSAGSGKTFTLVKEYLKLALGNKHQLTSAYKTILAVTFTNKAASEMKSRIILALKEISSDDIGFLKKLIADELNISTEDLQQRANTVLNQILHHYSDFSVGTIDSFTHRIIRTFAIDLKLPINFQIETDTDAVFKKVVSSLINNLGKDKHITDYLVEFSLSQVNDNKNWDPELILAKFIKELSKEGIKELINRLSKFEIADFELIKKQMNDFTHEFENTLILNGEKGLAILKTNHISENSLYQGNKGIYSFLKKIANPKEKYEGKSNLFNSVITAVINEDKWYAGKASVSEKTQIDGIKNDLLKIVQEVDNYLTINEERYAIIKLIKKHIHAIGLINELAKLIEKYKEDENILFISEFNQRISDIVTNEPTPFIFERLGDKYKHFLLDEFQDTSSMQWINMLPLIDNSLASQNLNLIVGDGKQSIYRWRNADVKQFVELPLINIEQKNTILTERQNSLIRNFEEKVLDTNFRSDSIIVEFNNQLFDYLSQNFLSDELKKIYNNQKQIDKKNGQGYVSIEFPEQVKKAKDTIDNEDETADEINLTYILKHINNAINDGYDYKDICIIVRTNKSGNITANYLLSNQIPVISSDSLLLSNAIEINVIISFLKYVANQNDLISASVVINYFYSIGKCTESEYISFLNDINKNKSKNLFKILEALRVDIQLSTLVSLNLFDSCIAIINALNLNTENPQYIRFFLDEVLNFLTTHSSNNSIFIEWWEKRKEKASLIIPNGINAVSIMTVHASKGLEFPIVITPFINWKFEANELVWLDIEQENIGLPVALLSTGKSLESTKYKNFSSAEKELQVLDTLNMLYVDFTRAVERLHIISPKPEKENKLSCHTWLLNFALSCGNYNPQNMELVFGKLTTKQVENKKHPLVPQLQIDKLNTLGNKDVVKIKGAASYTYNEELVKAREYGILIHHILSQIKTEKDINVIINNTQLIGEISNLEAIQLKHDIKKLIELPNVEPYFKDGLDIKNEYEILTADGEILRPDRVVIIDDCATVIDYKTGKKNTSKYYNQLNSYEKALKELGYKSVTKMLLYIHEQEVELVN